jgi:HSP20 family protein
MPTIVRKSLPAIIETRREFYRAITWHVRASAWNPPTDIYETEEDFIVRVEIAGIRDEDFEVVVENNMLMISGQRPDLNERRAYHQMEIRFGRFDIAVEIPVPVRIEDAAAQYKDGFLLVQLPKAHQTNIKVE